MGSQKEFRSRNQNGSGWLLSIARFGSTKVFGPFVGKTQILQKSPADYFRGP